MTHIPVLLDEVLKYLEPKPGEKFIDATIDGGGHSAAILEKIESNGKVLGIEITPELFSAAKLKIENEKLKNLVVVNDSYVDLKKIAEREGFLEADGILFDLGMSSWHLDQSGRGFSFQKDELLDMRFNPEKDFSALEIVNTWSEEDLLKVISDYGEEKFARQIAKSIIEARKEKAITTTRKLAEIIKNSVPRWYGHRKINPATKTFQALRIAVNDELDNIPKGLDSAIQVLKSGGRLTVISFHALEDRIVKEKFKSYQKQGLAEILTKKTVKPDYREVKSNPRARSAKLRVLRKI